MATHAEWRKRMLNAMVGHIDQTIKIEQMLYARIEGERGYELARERRHKEVVAKMRWMIIGIFAVLAVALFTLWGTVCAGEVPITADAGVSVMIGYKQPAESVRDLGVGIGYRPTYIDSLGLEHDSRLLFLIGGNYGSGTGDLKVLARFSSWGGVDWLAGPGIMAIEEAGTYSLGPIGEFRIEGYAGNNPVQFSAGSGYVWRNPTEDNAEPNPVPLWVKIGVRTQ